jgi:hypothetical protein
VQIYSVNYKNIILFDLNNEQKHIYNTIDSNTPGFEVDRSACHGFSVSIKFHWWVAADRSSTIWRPST